MVLKAYQNLEWEDVVEGADLPAFSYELNQLRLVAFVRATGLYDYIHFDRDYAQSVGARDAFASNSHISGLLARLITDWAGPQADLHAMNFTLRGQCCAGDMLTIGGKVGRKYRNDAGQCLAPPTKPDDRNLEHAPASLCAPGLQPIGCAGGLLFWRHPKVAGQICQPEN